MSDFLHHFEKIKVKDQAIANYLEEIGIEKWSRANFSAIRYNIMTSNNAESFNNTSRDARKYPITTLAEFMRYTLQTWFFERRALAMESNKPLPTKIEKKLEDRIEAAKTLIVQPLSHYEFYVMDGDRDGQVNLQTKTCSCRRFDLTGLPCTHALAATLCRRINPYSLCSWYYTVDAWLCSYAETIYPVGNEEEWDIPDDISRRMVKPPPYKPKAGRPKTKRTKSKGEKIIMQCHCSRCSGKSHNRTTCTYMIPTASNK
ncbi:Zinc finger, PMZ-type [Parasponia andersonii]|uniref:Zinc finger, PMZ-type n=1 Tax=Parasponia andersonii TaxID=3476 RepID=A0A2P5AE90_PARAD|nr:Zinc finger, PMZ-type [Parasponia andersonii]